MKKLYEMGIQYMNSWTWQKCSQEAIEILKDAGFTHRVNERSLRTLNTKFRVNEKLSVPFLSGTSTPSIFQVVPEFKDKIVRYCNKQVAEGTLSVD